MNKPGEAYALSWHATSLWCLSYYIWDGAIKPLDTLTWWQNEPECYFVHSDEAMSNVQNIFYQLLASSKARKSCKGETQLMISGVLQAWMLWSNCAFEKYSSILPQFGSATKSNIKKSIGVKPPWTSHFSNYSWINIKPGKKGEAEPWNLGRMLRGKPSTNCQFSPFFLLFYLGITYSFA